MALCVNRLILRKVRKQDRETPEFQKTGIWATTQKKKMPKKPEHPFTDFTILLKHWHHLKYCHRVEMTAPQSSYIIKLSCSSDPLQCLLTGGDRLISQPWIRSIGNWPGHFWRWKFPREALVFLCRVWILTSPSKIQLDAPSCTYQVSNMPPGRPSFVMTSPWWIKNSTWL